MKGSVQLLQMNVSLFSNNSNEITTVDEFSTLLQSLGYIVSSSGAPATGRMKHKIQQEYYIIQSVKGYSFDGENILNVNGILIDDSFQLSTTVLPLYPSDGEYTITDDVIDLGS